VASLRRQLAQRLVTAQSLWVLQEHTTYYLNIAFVDPSSGAATCSGGTLDSCFFFAETR
jgi:hypothetical protein